VEINDFDGFLMEFSSCFEENLDAILKNVKRFSYQSFQQYSKDIVPLLAEIAENPTHFPLARNVPSERRFRFAKFKGKYKVYFFMEEGKVVVVDIAHERRDLSALESFDDFA